MTPADILDSAKAAVTGPRNQTHGRFSDNFETIARFWNIYMSSRSGPLEPSDVARMMVLLKIARRLNGRPDPDHDIDGAGYFALAGALDQMDVY